MSQNNNVEPNHVVSKPGEGLQRATLSMVYDLRQLSGVTIECLTLDRIHINSSYEYMPNFELQWCTKQLHYRVYMHVGGPDHGKEVAGYPMFNIKSRLICHDFISFYQFMHRNRCNRK